MEHINTLKFFEELKAGGVPEEQARTQTYALNSALDHVATKEDLKHLESKFNGKFGMIEKACIAIIVLLLKVAFWP